MDREKKEYTVRDLKLRNSTVTLTMACEGDECSLNVSVDDYSEFGLRKGGNVSQETFEKLQERETEAKAMESCMRKITYRDRSSAEMREWLTKNTECSEENIERVVRSLERKGFLDDEQYCADQIASMRASLYGRDKIIRNLRKKGLKDELILRKLDGTDRDEAENALRFAQKAAGARKTDSLHRLKGTLQAKLIRQGYSSSVAADTVARMDFSGQEAKEKENLERCLQKAIRRYEKKYSGKELKKRVYNYAVQQGFRYEEAVSLLDEMDWSTDEED